MTGYALVLLALMIILGVPISGRTGLMFGAAGFAAVALAPAVGLPPELPGSAATALEGRQLWWGFTVAATSAGLAALLLGRLRWLQAAGLVLIALPHIFGAPHPDTFTSAVPGELSGHFAAASLALAAVTWALVGYLSGAIHERLAQTA